MYVGNVGNDKSLEIENISHFRLALKTLEIVQQRLRQIGQLKLYSKCPPAEKNVKLSVLIGKRGR